ncbi:hypothetical protein ACWGQ5_24350 [Streptomyces sp. NPDC055722]
MLHTLLVPDHLKEKFYIGVLFAVGSAVMLVVAVGLVTLKRPLVAWPTGALVSLGMIIGFVLSRTVGLPGGYYEPGWEPPYGVLASGAVDVTRGCQNGATVCVRWRDGPVVDLEHIRAETVAYFRELDEGATLRHHFRHLAKSLALG